MKPEALGFGMMRLPVLDGEPTNIDYKTLNSMVDTFLDAGYNYFDTSYMYHNGESENAVRKAVVERYPRDRFYIATKFPPFVLKEEAQVEQIFAEQLSKLGVDYVDYYMIHNVQTVFYDGLDGKGGIIQTTHLFDHLKGWKESGKAKHIGISFHSSPELLERVLKEHPEIEFVQLAINYIDWDSEFVQARACYELARKYGKKIICMEPVKGGGLAKLPETAEKVLKEAAPDKSVVSWAFRFLDSRLEDVITTLSGMSTPEQVKDNIHTMKEISLLTEREWEALDKVIQIYRDSTPVPTGTIEKYRGLTYHGVSATALLEAYSICQIQPDPGFAVDINYPKNSMAENHLDIDNDADFPEETVTLPDGTDGTPLLKEAEEWLRKHHF